MNPVSQTIPFRTRAIIRYLQIAGRIEKGERIPVAERAYFRSIETLHKLVIPRVGALRAIFKYNSISRAFHQFADGRIVDVEPSEGEQIYSYIPESWLNTQFKSFSEHPKVELPVTKPTYDLYTAIRERRSGSEFRLPPSREEIATLLRYACGEHRQGEGSRAQPSGGGLFPIEVYLLISSDSGDANLPRGAYHYDPQTHSLHVLSSKAYQPASLDGISLFESAAFVVMTGVFARNEMKYSDFGYKLMLLEAGHIGQNLYLVANALGLQCRGLGTGNINAERLNPILGIDGVDESIVYPVAVGRPGQS